MLYYANATNSFLSTNGMGLYFVPRDETGAGVSILHGEHVGPLGNSLSIITLVHPLIVHNINRIMAIFINVKISVTLICFNLSFILPTSFLGIKHQFTIRLFKYIIEHNGFRV